MSKCCGVYKITCLENGKFYIGSSKNIKRRWNNHRWNLRNGKHHNYFLQSDWNLYGEDVFVFEVLELCNVEDQFKLEQKYLDEYKPYSKFNVGYNLSEHTSEIGKKPLLRFLNYDNFGLPHYVKEVGVRWRMPITDKDYFDKSKEELQEEYEGYTTMMYLYDDMLMCDPDYE